MDGALRGAAVTVVAGLAVMPAVDLFAIPNVGQRVLAGLFLAAALALGLRAVARREPFGVRFTTLVYGVLGVGVGLFGTARPLQDLLAYVVGLLAMNVLLHHVTAYGPVLAAFAEEDAISRRARGAVLRSLALSGTALGLAYAGSLAVLPLFALDLRLTDPLTAVAIAIALLAVLLLLALLPGAPFGSGRQGTSARPR